MYKKLDDLKYIKKHYGEKMSHLCRELFPSILECPGLLYHILSSNFSTSKSLYYDIVNECKQNLFKEYIYSFIEDNEIIENISCESVKELLESVGYDFYECKTNEDVQKFRKYYKKNEELCTFSDPDRINNYHIFFIVKKNVDEIKREDFESPRREDAYGVSVLDLQFDRGEKQRVSIKSRYNHIVFNPDATYSNNLDLIVPGLSLAFKKEYGFNIDKNYRIGFFLNNYEKARDGKFYKYNNEIHNIHYCKDNTIIKNGNIIDDYKDKGRYTLFDYFILDHKEKKIILYDENIHDSLLIHLNGRIDNIDIIKKDENREIRIIYDKDKLAIFKINKDNKLIGYSDEGLEKTEKNFIYFNEAISELHLPNLETASNGFMFYNRVLKELDLPKLIECGEGFMSLNYSIISVNLPNLRKVGSSFLHDNLYLDEISLPNLEECGDYFLNNNSLFRKIDLPKLKKCGDSFLYADEWITSINLPELETCGDYFLNHCNNDSIREIDLPKLIECGSDFMAENHSIKKVNLPSLCICGNYFLSCNNRIKEIMLPNLRICGNHFLRNNGVLETIYLPNYDIYNPNNRIYNNDFFKNHWNVKNLVVKNMSILCSTIRLIRGM